MFAQTADSSVKLETCFVEIELFRRNGKLFCVNSDLSRKSSELFRRNSERRSVETEMPFIETEGPSVESSSTAERGSGLKMTPGTEEIKGPGWPQSTILNSYFLSLE